MARQASHTMSVAARRAHEAGRALYKADKLYTQAQALLDAAPAAAEQAYVAMLAASEAYQSVCQRNISMIETMADDDTQSERRRQLVVEVNAVRDKYNKASKRFARAVGCEERYRRLVADRQRRYEEAVEKYRGLTKSVQRNVTLAHKTVGSDNCIARQAGVPLAYREAIEIAVDSTGRVNIYFGGIGTPTGPGHGHSVIGASGRLEYFRMPGAPHGPHNFI